MWIYRKNDQDIYEVGYLERHARGFDIFTVTETYTDKIVACNAVHYLNGGN